MLLKEELNQKIFLWTMQDFKLMKVFIEQKQFLKRKELL